MVDPRNIVTDEAFRLAPELLGTPLARPWRRGAAMAVDGLLVAILTNAPGALLGFAAAVVLFRASARNATGGYVRRTVRLTFRFAAAVILFTFVVSSWRSVGERLPWSGDGEPARAALGPTSPGPAGGFTPPAVPTEAFAFRAAPAGAASGGSTVASDSITRLQREVAQLRASRDELRARLEAEPGEGRGVLGWLRSLSEDLGLEFGWTALYFTAFLALWQGRTPGKRLLGIRVIRLDGKPMGWWASFERFGGYAASLATGLLGFFHIFWDRNRQGFHDKIAETVVVRD